MRDRTPNTNTKSPVTHNRVTVKQPNGQPDEFESRGASFNTAVAHHEGHSLRPGWASEYYRLVLDHSAN